MDQHSSQVSLGRPRRLSGGISRWHTLQLVRYRDEAETRLHSSTPDTVNGLFEDHGAPSGTVQSANGTVFCFCARQWTKFFTAQRLRGKATSSLGTAQVGVSTAF
jgi:hypothetical protein